MMRARPGFVRALMATFVLMGLSYAWRPEEAAEAQGFPAGWAPPNDSVEGTFTCGSDGGRNLDAGGHIENSSVPCPSNTIAIHVKVPAGADGGLTFGGSAVVDGVGPIIRGPGDEYTVVRSKMKCAPPRADHRLVLKVPYMCFIKK